MNEFKKQHGNLAGMTPLHLAAVGADKSKVEQLLNEGSNPNQLNKVGVPPLFSVLKLPMSTTCDEILDRENIFRLLWETTEPAIRLGRDELGGTVLHLIAIHGFDCLAQEVLRAAPQLSSIARRYHNQDYPIHTAILNGQYEIAKILFDLDAETSTYLNALEQLPLHVAALCGSKAILTLCCEHYKGDIDQLDRDGQTALAVLRERFSVTEEQKRDFEQCLIAKGAKASNINRSGITQLGF